jgi:hypothetical protein
MDQFTDVLNSILSIFSPAIIIFMVVIFACVSAQRKILELFFKRFWQKVLTAGNWWNTLYNELFLPAGPVVTGLVLALIFPNYPFPEFVGTSLAARLFFGIFAGLVSGWAYARVKKLFLTKVEQLEEQLKTEEENKDKSQE